MDSTLNHGLPDRARLIDAVGGGGFRRDAGQLSPLVLAYIGDALYDLFVRTRLIAGTDLTAHGLHVKAAGRVCAKAQARACRTLMDKLSEQEAYILKRGRNAHMGTVPKHASIADYRLATGLEALIGYLYLTGQDERLNELMALALSEPDIHEED